MSSYSALAKNVKRLLKEQGAIFALKRVIEGVYNPVGGTTVGGSIKYASVVGVFTQISTDYAAANVVQSDDQMLVIDGSIEPKTTDKIVVRGVELEIVKVNRMNPAGIALSYKLQVRGAIPTVDTGEFSSTVPADTYSATNT